MKELSTKKTLLAIAIVVLHLSSMAQVRPYINSISPTIANVGETVTIVGSGFPASVSDLQVTFGGVNGTIISNSSTLIEVTVPSAAQYDEIMVTNTATGLSGSSSSFFMVSYGGDPLGELSLTAFRGLFEGIIDLDISTTADRTQQFPYDLCLCDFDQDGKQDVVVTAQENSSSAKAKRVVFRNTSSITSLNLNPVLELRNQPSTNVNCKDLDGDGKPDMVISEKNGDGDSGTEDLEVYLNTSTSGSISFQNPVFLILPENSEGDKRFPARIEIEDIDQDGKNDIISSTNSDNAIDIFLNQSTKGALSFATSINTVRLPDQDEDARALKVADLNNDGLKDIVLAELAGTNVFSFENLSTSGNVRFGEATLLPISDQLLIQNIEVADINGDGFNEVIVSDGTASQNSGSIVVFENATNDIGAPIEFSNIIPVNTNSFPFGIHVGDLDGDQKPDIVTGIANQTEGFFDVLINQSTTDQIDFTTFTLPTNNNSRNIRIADLNGDVKPDILMVTNSRALSNGSLSVYLNRNCVTPVLSPLSDVYCPGSSFIVEATPAGETTFDFEVSTDGGSNWTSKQSGSSNTYDVGADASNTTDILVRVRATSNDGRCTTTSNSSSLSLNNNTPPSFSITAPANVCAGADLTLNTSIIVDNYFWEGPNGFTSTQKNPTISAIEAASGGTYQLVIQEDDGCKSSAQSAQVEVIATPIPNFANTGPDAFCTGGQTVLETTDFTGFTRQWNINGNPITNATSTSLTVDATGDYSLTLTSSANANCSSTGESLTINEVDPPVATIQSESEICVDVPFRFESTVSGASEYNFTYSWDLQDAGSSTIATGVLDSLAVTFSTSGTYTANLTVGYELVDNCTSNIDASAIASDPPTIPITATATVKCPLDTVTLEMPSGLVTYLWSTGDTSNTTLAITPEGIDTVNIDVTVTTDIGCTVNSSIQVTNFDDGGITITSVDPNIPIVNQSLSIPSGTLSIQLEGNGGTNYQWEPSIIFDDPEASLVNVRPRSVTTDVILTGIDINSCLETDSLRVINDNVQARKSFSPNGDGLGFECWEILNTSVLDGCTLYILDKRGRTIYQADTPFENDCAWDGIDADGKQAPEGVYYFVMKCTEGELNRTGSLLLGR
jgi:gliding motility-associated-like protein